MDSFRNILKQRFRVMQSAATPHPSSDTLVAFVERELNGPQRETVLAHLSVCPDCREAVALATPEVAQPTAQPATRSFNRALQFPAAMRWASLAAALAVAVGVGVIAYEHAPERQLTTFNAPQQKSNAAASSQAPTKEEVAQNSFPPSATRSLDRAQPHAAAPQRREPNRSADQDRKVTRNEGVLGALSASLPNAPSKQKYELQKAAVPSTSETQPAFADKRDATPLIPAVAPPPAAQSGVVNAENKAVQDASDNVAKKPDVGLAYGGAIGRSSALVQSEVVPAKTMNAVSVSGVKSKSVNAVRGFVRWTISAAGKLQRFATDGTMTVIEPIPGAIIRAVAAEGIGIEVWAGGSQSAPSAKNVQPRSMLFHSSDAGETWKTIDGPWQGSITRVNLAGLGSLTVVTTDGTWSTGDGGKSWSRP